MKRISLLTYLSLLQIVKAPFPFGECPDGRPGGEGCNGRDPYSCLPTSEYFCWAPLDYGVCCPIRPQFPFPGTRPMRCPDGRLGFRRCNGFDPNSCRPRRLFFCFAPADAGVCCRQRGQCPRPSRRPCFGFRPGRPCYRDTDCWYGQICCEGPCVPTQDAGQCPRPSRRPCFGFRPGRSCYRDTDCWYGQICCEGPCGRRCTYPRRRWF